MIPLWRLVVELARHELHVAVRTRRAVGLAAVYLVTAVVGGLAYTFSLRFIERQALALLRQSGMDPVAAGNAVSLASEGAYRDIVGLLAGIEPASVEPSILGSAVVPVLLWGSLAFLPYVVVLTSFDQVAGDLASRAILYPTLRVPRAVVLTGKLLAQLVSFTVLTAAAAVTLVVIAGGLLSSVTLAEALRGTLRVTALLVPFGACYVGLTAFASASVRQPAHALFLAVGIMLALRVLGWFAHVPADAPLGALRVLSYLSPARYHEGLWRSGLEGPLVSSAAYLAFALGFAALAAWRLEERDL